MGDDADSHELLSVVAAVHHERVGEALNDGALGLAEALDGIPASGVGDVDGLADLDVISVPFIFPLAIPRCLSHMFAQKDTREGNISDLDVLVAPLVEQLGGANLAGDILGQDGVALRRFDFDLAVRHVRCCRGKKMTKGRGLVVVWWMMRLEIARMLRSSVCDVVW